MPTSRLLWLMLGLVVLLSGSGFKPAQAQDAGPTKPPVVEPTKAPLSEPTKAAIDPAPPKTEATPKPTPLEVTTAIPAATATVLPATTTTASATPAATATVAVTRLNTVTAQPTRPAAVTTTATLTPVFVQQRPASISTATPQMVVLVSTATLTPTLLTVIAPAGAPPIGNAAATEPPRLPPVIELSGLLLTIGGGLAFIALAVWLGLDRLGQRLLSAYRSGTLADLSLRHEAERVARRDKIAPRDMADVRALLEQALLDALGEAVSVKALRDTDLLIAPPLLAVTGSAGRRFAFSPLPVARINALRRSNAPLAHVLGAGTLTAYPLDALNSTPFIADDLASAFQFAAAKWQRPRTPLPRTDQWTVYVVTPKGYLSDAQARPRVWLKRLTGRLLLPDKPEALHSDQKDQP